MTTPTIIQPLEPHIPTTSMDDLRGTLQFAYQLNDMAAACHQAAVDAGWWHDLTTGEPLVRNKGEMLALIHSEISEALEGERKDLMDDKLPHRPMPEVELADAMIRIFDYARAYEYDIGGAMIEKMLFNASREDHKPENRRKAGGVKY